MHIQYTYINKKGIEITSNSRSMKLKEGTELLIQVLDNGIKAKFRYRNIKDFICECGHSVKDHDLHAILLGVNAFCSICNCEMYMYKEVKE